jgi:hypoxanthine phosphoribosyltransferase
MAKNIYTTLFYPTWMHIQKGCSVIARQILSLNKNCLPKTVVAIGPDGFVPGVIISNILDIPLFGINYRSQISAHPFIDGIERKEYQIINGMVTNDLKDKPSILLIDSIVNSGHTMDEMYEKYESLGHLVYGSSLYVRDGSIFFPAMYWNKILKEDPNVEFPWEI